MRTQNLNMCVFFDYFEIMSIIPSLTVAKESRAHKRRNYAIYELLFSF